MVRGAAPWPPAPRATHERGDDHHHAHQGRPAGPSAELTGPLEGGNGIWLASSGGGPSLAEAGYSEAEYAASGTATSYASASGDCPPDGVWELEPSGEADYCTRVIVRRPDDAVGLQRHGRGGVAQRQRRGRLRARLHVPCRRARRGAATRGWACPRSGSAIEGGDIAVDGARGAGRRASARVSGEDPERTATSTTRATPFAYDIFTQVGARPPLPRCSTRSTGSRCERVLAVGESQSAFTLTTYVNGVQPLTEQFDGFLIHSRGGGRRAGRARSGLDVVSAIVGADDASGPTARAGDRGGDGDRHARVLGHHEARQPDSDRYRLWEIAGTAHADRFQVGAVRGGARLSAADQPRSAGVRPPRRAPSPGHVGDEGAAPPEADAPRGGRDRRDADVRPRRRRQRDRRRAITRGRRAGRRPVRLRGAGSPDRVHPHGQHHAAHRGAARRALCVAGRLPAQYGRRPPR